MKRNLLIAFVLFISITSCKKDKPPVPEVEDRKPEVLIKEITTKLAGADSISTFTAALKSIALTVDETAQGITVFAVLNQGTSPQGRLGKVGSAGGNTGKTSFSTVAAAGDTVKTALTDSELRDHIVKGVFNFANLTNGKVLITLNGKELKVTRAADTVWINGVRIGGQQIVSSNNEAVFAVKSVLTGTTPADEPQSTSLEVTIWDATLWSVSKPKGELAANALVTLYNSQKDYADSIPAHQGTTDATGKVIFKTVSPGVYYIKVNQGIKSNIFNRSAKQNGLYLGYANIGVFQNPTEVAAAPAQLVAAPGDFKWADGNSDQIINDNDRVTLPYEKATVTAGALRKVEVMIGLLKNTQVPAYTETEFNTNLSAVETNLATWHKKLVLVDALLSRQAVTDSIPSVFNTAAYQAINNYTVNVTNQVVTDIWRQGYEYIASLSTLQERAPNGIAERAEKIARVRGMRAYVYLQLLTYYGNISLQYTPGKLNNKNWDAVMTYIATELGQAAAILPDNTSSTTNINAHALRMLSARAALITKDYPVVALMTEAVINSGRYPLAAQYSEFNANSSEIVWNNSANMDDNMKNLFFQRANLPYLRITEAYLMAAEANIVIGNITKAQNYYNIVAQRSKYTVETVTLARIRSLWANELRREGSVFVAMLRWETAAGSLSSKGFSLARNSRLPIPQSVIEANPDMAPNPGY